MLKLSKPRRATLVVAALLSGLGLVATGASPASAAVIDGAVIDITVSPTNVAPFSPVRTTIDWCVPDGTSQGDTFTITMPEQLGDFPPSFQLLDPAGALVATATIGGNPVTATITMTDYVETRSSVCGDAWFESRLTADGVENTTQTLTYVVNGGLTFERDINVTGAVVPTRDSSAKRGEFADPADQCRTSITDCIDWVLASRSGPFDEVQFNDLAADGLTFNCSEVLVTYWSLNPDGSRNAPFQPGAVGATATVDCSTTSVSVSTGPVPEAMIVRIRIPSTPDGPASPDGSVYTNSATVSQTIDEETVVDEVSAERRSAAAGGTGVGVGIDIEKVDGAGNDADTAAESVELPTGETDLVFTIVNTGDALVNVEVTDVVTTGAATVSGLTCDFSEAATGAPTSGTTWAGPFPAGAQFTCSATLTGVAEGATHANTATVTGEGAATGEPVTDSDDYHANRTPPGVTTTTTTPPTTVTVPPVVPPTTEATTTTVIQNPPTTPAPPTTNQTTSVRLPETGAALNGVAIALLLLGAGGILSLLAARRRPSGQH